MYLQKDRGNYKYIKRRTAAMKKDKSKFKTEFLNSKIQNSQNKYFDRMTEEKKINTQNRKKKKIENVRL